MTDYIYFGTRSIIVCSENVTKIQHTKYIAEDSFSANIGGIEGHFPSYPAVWKVNIIYLC